MIQIYYDFFFFFNTPFGVRGGLILTAGLPAIGVAGFWLGLLQSAPLRTISDFGIWVISLGDGL